MYAKHELARKNKFWIAARAEIFGRTLCTKRSLCSAVDPVVTQPPTHRHTDSRNRSHTCRLQRKSHEALWHEGTVSLANCVLCVIVQVLVRRIQRGGQFRRNTVDTHSVGWRTVSCDSVGPILAAVWWAPVGRRRIYTGLGFVMGLLIQTEFFVCLCTVRTRCTVQNSS